MTQTWWKKLGFLSEPKVYCITKGEAAGLSIFVWKGEDGYDIMESRLSGGAFTLPLNEWDEYHKTMGLKQQKEEQ